MRRIYPCIIGLCAIVIASCTTNNNNISKPSDVARLVSMTFVNDTTNPGLQTASFTVEERLDTGLVYNADSIRFGTRLDSVVPVFRFAATPGEATLHTPDTIFALGGADTVNFTKQPIYLRIVSQDGQNTKVYQLQAEAHKLDPELFEWQCLTQNIYPADNSEQQVLRHNDKFILYKDNGFSIHFYTSADGIAWSSEQTPIGLPDGCSIRGIISDGETLYYASDTQLYTSADGQNWQKNNYDDKDFTFQSMLMAWNETVWAIGLMKGKQVLLAMQDGQMQPTNLYPEGDFPVSDFAAVVFESASLRQRAMIIGGYAANGKPLNTRWNIEYSTAINTNGGYRMEEFSIGRPTFKSLTGVSVVWYNHMLYMFGGVDEQMNYKGRDILVSQDEGMTWLPADTSKNKLPETYTARQRQSAIIQDNNIYLFGGETQTHTFSDVYKGRLNSIDWNKNK